MTSALVSLAAHCREFDLGPLTVDRPTSIYFLLAAEEIVYVGQTTNLDQRIAFHIAAGRVPDRVVFLAVDPEDADAYEGALIRALNPRWCHRAPADCGRDVEVLARLGLVPDETATFAARIRWEWHQTRAYAKRARPSRRAA